jgi:hypothetical protein
VRCQEEKAKWDAEHPDTADGESKKKKDPKEPKRPSNRESTSLI